MIPDETLRARAEAAEREIPLPGQRRVLFPEARPEVRNEPQAARSAGPLSGAERAAFFAALRRKADERIAAFR